MPRIRIPKEHWSEVWMTLVEVGAISRVSVEPIYLVSKKHIDVLQEKNLPFEFVNSSNAPTLLMESKKGS